mgnify:CR=1 FL=1
MSTRGVLAVVEGDGWKGLYQHSDSYPTWLGKGLWAWLQEHGTKEYAKTLKKHPGGYSSFPEVCYCHDESFGENGKVPTMRITSKRPDPLFIEWVYAVDVETEMVSVFEHQDDEAFDEGRILDSPKLEEDGWWNYGHCRYRHRLVGVFDLKGLEPDWEALESRELAVA